MSANLSQRTTENPAQQQEQHGGVVWHRLHSERESICEALLKESASVATTPDAQRIANWHHDLLQVRLSKVDDALDRLMSGSYGNCKHCDKWIEDTKLDFDPAIAYCIGCWERMQTRH